MRHYERCTLWFCQSDGYYGRTWCRNHYHNWMRTGTPLPPRFKDMLVILMEFNKAWVVLQKMVGEFDSGYGETIALGGGRYRRRCMYCQEEVEWVRGDRITTYPHTAECPIPLGRGIVGETDLIDPDTGLPIDMGDVQFGKPPSPNGHIP